MSTNISQTPSPESLSLGDNFDVNVGGSGGTWDDATASLFTESPTPLQSSDGGRVGIGFGGVWGQREDNPQGADTVVVSPNPSLSCFRDISCPCSCPYMPFAPFSACSPSTSDRSGIDFDVSVGVGQGDPAPCEECGIVPTEK